MLSEAIVLYELELRTPKVFVLGEGLFILLVLVIIKSFLLLISVKALSLYIAPT